MPRLLSLWKQGRLKLDHLISGRIQLGEINDGFAKLKSGDSLQARQVYALLNLELWFRIFVDNEKGWIS